jgi:hypothetical protein
VAFDEPPSLTSIRAHLPEELQRIVSRCLKKNPDERYPEARVLARDLRELRRSTEAGLTPRTNWRYRLTDAWERLQHLPPSQYAWFGTGLVIAGLAVYLSFSKIGTGGAVFLTLAVLYIYRQIRNRPQKVQEQFVRRVAKIPEVRLITCQRRQFTVVVDRPVAQLYSRINQQLQSSNRKLFFGQPLTAAIVHSLTDEKTQQLLSGPGVQYVREDVVKTGAPEGPG